MPGTIQDERNVLAAILNRRAPQRSQLIRSHTTLGHTRDASREARQQTFKYIQQQIPQLSPSTLADFAIKNQEQHNVEFLFACGLQLVAVTDEEVRELLRTIGWRGLPMHCPGTKGVIECSRVGFNHDANEALVYFGHQRAARSGSGSFRLFERKADEHWVELCAARAWIS